MILYHFTSWVAWERIRKDGTLLLSDPQVHPSKRGRPVVWLTKSDVCQDATAMGLASNPTVTQLADFDRIDKTRVRITVDVAKTYTHRWREWAPKHGGHPGWLSHIHATCSAAGTWYVHTKPIPRADWQDVLDVGEDRHLSIAPTVAQLGFRKLHA